MGLLESICVLAAVAAFSADPSAPALFIGNSQVEPSQWTLQRVRETVEANRQRLRSLYLEAGTIGRDSVDGRKVVNTILAVKGSKRFCEVAHGTDIEADSERRQSYLSPEKLETVWVLDRYCKRSREQAWSQVSASTRCHYFMECTGWYPPDDPTPLQHMPDAALHLTLEQDTCQVQGELEYLDSHRCVVVEIPGQDRIWLDVDRGCTLVQRHRKSHNVFWVYKNSDFREMAPHLWLPWKLYRLVHYGNAPGKLTGNHAMIVEGTHTVTKMEVNSVSDKMLLFMPPPGTLMHDYERGEIWQIPGGVDVLDKVSSAAAKRIKQYRGNSGRSVSWSWNIILWAAVLQALVGAVCWSVYRRRRLSGIPVSAT